MNEAPATPLLRVIAEKGEFVTDLDGFVKFWPSGDKGAFDPWMLRVIADELDRRNEQWVANIDQYFSEHNEG